MGWLFGLRMVQIPRIYRRKNTPPTPRRIKHDSIYKGVFAAAVGRRSPAAPRMPVMDMRGTTRII